VAERVTHTPRNERPVPNAVNLARMYESRTIAMSPFRTFEGAHLTV